MKATSKFYINHDVHRNNVSIHPNFVYLMGVLMVQGTNNATLLTQCSLQLLGASVLDRLLQGCNARPHGWGLSETEAPNNWRRSMYTILQISF